MNKNELIEEIQRIRQSLNDCSGALEEQLSVTQANLPPANFDAEGFLIPDGSDLSDLMRSVDAANTRLSRISFAIGRFTEELGEL